MSEKIQLRSGAHQINVQCNISTVIGKTMRNVSSVYLSKHCSPQYCQLNKGAREVPFLSPDISVLMDSGMAQIDTSLENGLFRMNKNVQLNSKQEPAPQEKCSLLELLLT
ncbi:hypothetical protein XENORESO_002033, partial [Xenotaenia resolanae]